MSKEIEIHPIQAEILNELLFKKECRFSELNIKDITTDLFIFHIKKLLKDRLVEKTINKTYRLTDTGKEFANRFDTDTKEVEKQAKVSVKIVAFKDNSDKGECLLQQRLKQPFYGCIDLVGGKIRWGEDVLDAAARELMEESGLEADLEVIGVLHKKDYEGEDKLLEDKFFFIIKAKNIRGKLVEDFEGGKNMWFPWERTNEFENMFKDVETMTNIALKKIPWFEETFLKHEKGIY